MSPVRSRWVSGVLASLVITGCYSAPPMQVDGNLEVRGADLGHWFLDPGICLTGEPDGFEGVDLSSGTGEHCVRFVDDPDEGPLVIAYIPGTSEGRTFAPDDCDKFHVYLERTRDQDDVIYNVGGTMTIDCESEDGTIVGELAFDGCW